MKKALITGIFGQDGSYLAELLSLSGYEVHGIVRVPLSSHAEMIRVYLEAKGIRPTLHKCRLSNLSETMELIKRLQPDECYHLAATHFSSQARAKSDRLQNVAVYNDNTGAALHLLSAFAEASPHTSIVLAGSCLMFSDSDQSPQNEMTPFASSSLYGLSKIAMTQLGAYFRSECGLHVSTAILYNHESPRRQKDFVTKKIVSNLKRIKEGVIAKFELNNLHSVKDWGYAKDYAAGMRLMARFDMPTDFVLATGVGHTVEDLVYIAAERIGISDWRSVVKVSTPTLPIHPFIPLIGDPSLAVRCLEWEHSMTFENLIDLMVEAEINGSLD